MKLSTFLLLNVALALLDFVITYGVENGINTGLVIARFCGSTTAIAGLLLWTNRLTTSVGNRALPVIISVVTIAVNYGLFTLLHSRNAVLNWHVLFAITTLAALVLGAVGYRRALTKSTSQP